MKIALAILLATPLLALSCATQQLEIDPNLTPGEGVGLQVKSCFSADAVKSKYGFGIPGLWNSMNGCKNPEEEEPEAPEAPVILDSPVVPPETLEA